VGEGEWQGERVVDRVEVRDPESVVE